MKQIIRILLVLLLAGALRPVASAAREEERAKELEKERAKLLKETDPVDRAKIGIKISDLLIEDLGDAVRKGNFDEMQLQITAYTTTIEDAHQTLVNSGRNASKKPSGFKELEIALRKHARRIDEFARTLNLDRRIPFEETKTVVVGIRDKLLKALFP